jgi:methionyl-tRNA formyltransferase
LFLGCEQGVLEVLELQPPSRARMTAAAFLRGYAGRLSGEMRPVSP